MDESWIREEIRRQSVRYARATLTDDELYAEVTLEVLSFWHGYLERSRTSHQPSVTEEQ